ncbi:2-oxoacid:acceptor oxidoreductase family protein [Parendozoicomonas haliclonae]|uniref:NADH-dependent phenylglyoxylate dehydrogenase subunit gamma n=1 Tax=Parendozoicomonas haliclonae TaxID=1960125 RepID=A0A1X7ANZ7_9GAMM|nr:2-oxoacid:acceptor oxidoreductase family protein [Parendozoicomonas haliclonae]SMA49809.1 NADH-dependent phenylglyoxylate dehydrogenase subunit gamma [Parendozoicomonas haliclonae]
MFQVRIHGRGGQGVVSAAEMLSIALFHEGAHAQAIPSFGSERMGAPVEAYVRISDQEIELREPVSEPDMVIIQDPSLLHALDVFAGLSPNGYVLINTSRSLEELGIQDKLAHLPAGHIHCLPGTELALEYLRRPTPNTVLLGAFCAVVESFSMESLGKAINQKFAGIVAEKNIEAAQAAFDKIKEHIGC